MANRVQIRFVILLLFVLSFLASPLEAKLSFDKKSLGEYHFLVPSGLESQVGFWKKVYSQYTTDDAIVHDMENLNVIYEVVSLVGVTSERARERKRDKIKAKYRKILRSLARKKTNAKLTPEEGRVAGLVKTRYSRAARNVRVQIGQKNRFRDGLVRSGRYMDQIRKIFKERGLPEELTVLPHVESSFQLNAYSSAGAAGIWQFTRRTGRQFLKVGYAVDERMDPILATIAASKLLKKNFEHIHNWPLAITAYNHGLQGMKRAKRIHGPDIVRIIERYRSRSFGFASQNFYAEFLAALDVVRNQEKHFPNLKMDVPLQTVSVTFPHHIDIATVVKTFNMSVKEIHKYNYSLRRPVISGQKRIPSGFVFNVPAERFSSSEGLYARIPDSLKFRRQIASKWYTVRRGDTLSGIAARFHTSARMLKRLNNVGRRNMIYVSQVLQLPQPSSRKNSRSRVASSQPIVLTGLKTVDYKVRRNDNLTKIARRFQIEHEVLVALNQMKNPDILYPGQVIKVPENKTVSSVRVIKKADGLLIKSSNGRKPRKFVESTVTLKFADNKVAIGNNQNSPAFLPVSFAPTKHKDSMVGDITVDLGETLSHYADWAKLGVRELRRFNNMRRSRTLKFHEKIKVPFYRTSPAKFEMKRQGFHKAIQEDFFDNYRVQKTLTRKIKKGETLWEISKDIYSIPFWLLRQYNSNRDIYALSVGDSIVIPLITKANAS